MVTTSGIYIQIITLPKDAGVQGQTNGAHIVQGCTMTILIILDHCAYGSLCPHTVSGTPFSALLPSFMVTMKLKYKLSSVPRCHAYVYCASFQSRTTTALNVIPPQCRAWQCNRSSRGKLYKCQNQPISVNNTNMKNLIFGLSLIASAFVSTQAVNTGVDVSALVSTDSWSCAKGLGYSHAIVRCYFEAWGGNPVCKI